MITAQFRVEVPETAWVADLSRAFPDAEFRLLSGLRLEQTAVELGETVTDDPEAVVAAFREHPAITSFELLEATDRRLLGKYETTDTALYDFVELSAVPVEFPLVVRGGWYDFDLTGTREELDRFRDTLDAAGLTYELGSLVETADGEGLLTDRQREVLAAARRAGYYEVPRECTLADLADSLGVDKSTASTVLRRAEGRLVDWFLAGPASGDRPG